MITHNISMDSLTPHGKVALNVNNDELFMETNTALYTHFHNNDTPINSYACVPNKYKLPFRIDMTVKIDSPALYLLVGRGHVEFATGSSHRGITDILGDDFKPNKYVFDNNIPLDEYVDISVIYGSKAMCVDVNNKCRCLSANLPYIKAQVSDEFNIAIACDKRTQLTLKKFVVTEYENEEPDVSSEPPVIEPAQFVLSEKPTVETAIQCLSPELQSEILSTDEYLRKLKLKRKIENWNTGGRITYVSPLGFRYKIEIAECYMWHDLSWIAYNTRREVEKYGGRKKADYTVETLTKLSESSPEFADEMFSRMQECKGCNTSGCCNNIWVYEFNGKKKISCVWDGGMRFKMIPSDFADLRKVVGAISSIL
jgi:hypothetical protein